MIQFAYKTQTIETVNNSINKLCCLNMWLSISVSWNQYTIKRSYMNLWYLWQFPVLSKELLSKSPADRGWFLDGVCMVVYRSCHIQKVTLSLHDREVCVASTIEGILAFLPPSSPYFSIFSQKRFPLLSKYSLPYNHDWCQMWNRSF